MVSATCKYVHIHFSVLFAEEIFVLAGASEALLKHEAYHSNYELRLDPAVLYQQGRSVGLRLARVRSRSWRFASTLLSPSIVVILWRQVCEEKLRGAVNQSETKKISNTLFNNIYGMHSSSVVVF